MPENAPSASGDQPDRDRVRAGATRAATKRDHAEHDVDERRERRCGRPRWRRSDERARDPTASRNSATSTTQSRAERRAVGAAAQLARQQQALPARQGAWSCARPSSSAQRTHGRGSDPLPKSIAASTRPAVAASGRAAPIAGRHDRSRRPHQALRRAQPSSSDVSFRCEPGTVTGFLGPNGAGKTTTMRMLCGLSDARRRPRDRARRPLPRAAQPGPARRRAARRLAPSTPAAAGARRWPSPRRRWASTRARVDELLDAASGSTASAARKRVRQYSLGMRQRLGLAHALLGDPEVLILDEPANGLDPEGIRWMRGLLRDFADRGGTVLLSSHLLREVEAVADRLVIIGGGRIVAQGTRDELLAGAGMLVRGDRRARRSPRALRGADLTRADRRRRASSSTPSRGRSAAPRSPAASPHPPRPGRGRRPRAALLRPHRGARMSDRSDARRPPTQPPDRVELRKMVDTRAGFWLQLPIAAAHARWSSCVCISATPRT